MKLVIQRVQKASVIIDGCIKGAIGSGLLVFFGAGDGDTKEGAELYADKLIKLRIFGDENGKTNRSLLDVSGELLIVSQFTLYADCRKGNRPSFTKALNPEEAKQLYDYFVEVCRKLVSHVATGEFGADMQVELVNDGPFTILLEEDSIKLHDK